MPLIDGVPLDNPGMRWAHRATSEPLPSYDADLSDLKRTGRDGVVSLAGTTSPVVLRIVVQTPRENLESLIALFRQGKIWSNGGRETPFEFKSISPTGFGPADQVIDATFVIRLPGAFMRAKDPETTALALTGTSHTLSCFAARPVGLLSLDKNLLTNPSFETGSGTVVVRTNWIRNSNFETDATLWTTTNAATQSRSTAQAHRGSASLQVVTAGTTAGEGIYATPYTVPGVSTGTPYAASIWVWAPVGATMEALANTVGTGGAVPVVSFTGTGAWQFISMPNNLSNSGLSPYIVVRTRNTAQAITFYVDEAILETGISTVGPYFDAVSQPILRTNLHPNPVPASAAGYAPVNTATIAYSAGDVLVTCAPGVADSGVRLFQPTVTTGSPVTISVEVQAVVAGSWRFSGQLAGQANQGAGPYTFAAGETRRLTFTYVPTAAGTANIYILRQDAAGNETFRVRKVQVEAGSVATSYFDGTTVLAGFAYGFTGTANASPSIEWDADFSTRWQSTANASASELTGISPATVSTVISYPRVPSVQSSRWALRGVRSVRVLAAPGTNDSFAVVTGVPVVAGQTYTVVAIVQITATQGAGQIAGRARGIYVATGANTTTSAQPPDAPGVYEVRHTFTATTTSADIRLYNGCAVGGADVWWDLGALVAGTYTGPAFTGSTAPPDRLTLFGWDGLPDQSTSTRTVYASWDGGFSAPVQDAVIRVKGAATGIQVTDSSGAWAILPDVPAGQWIRFETDTGRAYQTATDVWTGGNEVSGLVDFGGPRGVFEITPVMAPGDPGSRSGQVTVTTASRTGAVIEVRGKAAYLL